MTEELQTIREQLGAPSEEGRRLAVSAMAAHRLEDVKGLILMALGDESWRVRKEAADLLLAMNAPPDMAEELIALLSAHDNAGLRNSAVEVLVRMGKEALPALQRHTRDEDQDVRKFVLDIMGDIGLPSSVPFLVTALDDPDPNVSAAAAENIGKIGAEVGIEPLLAALGKNDLWLRHTILEALAKIGRPIPMELLAPLASERLLQKALYDCLGAVGDDAAVPFLMEGLKQRAKNAREAAAMALMKVRDRLPEDTARNAIDSRLAELKDSPFVEGLLASLETAERATRDALVRILGLVGDSRAVLGLLRGCGDDRLRQHCFVAFRSIGKEAMTALAAHFPAAAEEERCFISFLVGETAFRPGMPLLREGLRDASPALRRTAVTAAARMEGAELVDDITPLLDDDDQDVQHAAIEALTQLAPEARDRVERLALSLADTDLPESRRNAAILLGALNDADKLTLLAKDEDAEVRKSALYALAGVRPAPAATHFAMALVDEDPDVRIAAATALGEAGGEAALESLLLSLMDDDPWVRCSVIRALVKVGGERAHAAISPLLDSLDGIVVIAALEALVEIGEGVSPETLEKALANPDEEVVKAAIDILAQKGKDWVARYQERLLAHPHWDVRRAYVSVMADILGKDAVPHLLGALETEQDPLVAGRIKEVLEALS